MNHRRFQDHLDEYLAGALAPADRAAADLHLESCAACRQALESARRLRAAASGLPRSIEPPRDLWPAIAERLPPRPQAAPGTAPAARGHRIAFPPVAWAAAAALIVAVLALGLVMVRLSPPSLAPAPDAAAGGPSVAGAPAAAPDPLVGFANVEAESSQAAGDLLARLEARGSALAEQALPTLVENLGVIDGAIREVRLALTVNPNDSQLVQTLRGSYQRKLVLIRQLGQLLEESHTSEGQAGAALPAKGRIPWPILT